MPIFRTWAFVAVCVFSFFIPAESIAVLTGFGTLGKLAGLVAFAFGVAAVLSTEARRGVTPYLLLAGLFIFWGFLSYWWSYDQQATIRLLITLAQVLLMVWLLSEFSSAPQAPLWFMQAYVLGASLTAASSVNQYLNQAATAGRVTAFDLNANALALILLLAIPMAWYLSMKARRWYLVWGNRLAIPLMMWAILLTGSRSGTIAMLIALSFIPFSLRNIRWGAKLLGVLAVVITLGAAWTQLPQRTALRLLGGQDEVAAALAGDPNAGSYRVGIWLSGFHAFSDHPMVGHGAGAFHEAMKPYYTLYSNPYEESQASHNTFLAVLVEQGTIGLVLYLALIGYLLYQTRRMGRTERLLCIILLLAWMAANMFINQVEEKHTWFMFTVVAVLGQRPVLADPSHYAPQPS